MLIASDVFLESGRRQGQLRRKRWIPDEEEPNLSNRASKKAELDKHLGAPKTNAWAQPSATKLRAGLT